MVNLMANLFETRIGSNYHEISIMMGGRRLDDDTHSATLIEARMTAYPKKRKDRLAQWHHRGGERYDR